MIDATDTATIATPAEPAAAPHGPHMTLTVPALDWGERRAVRAEVTRLHDELKAALKPELWSLVFMYAERCREDELVGETNMMWAMVEGLAAHLPGQAPMLRCLAQHVLEADFGHSDGCGLMMPPEPAGTA